MAVGCQPWGCGFAAALGDPNEVHCGESGGMLEHILLLHIPVRRHVSRLFWAVSLAWWPDIMSLPPPVPTLSPLHGSHLIGDTLNTSTGAWWPLGLQQHHGCHSAPVNAAGWHSSILFLQPQAQEDRTAFSLYCTVLTVLLTWVSQHPPSLSQHQSAGLMVALAFALVLAWTSLGPAPPCPQEGM